MTRRWQDIARSLPIGSKRKVECCSTDPSTYISSSHRGIHLGPCFRCGHREYEPHGPRSIAEVLKTRQALEALASQDTPKMPSDAVPVEQGPPEAILWVLKGGLSPEQASSEYGMRWHEETRRVWIPIPNGLLGRAVFGERPKYRMLGKPGVLYWPEKRSHSAVVVVEDCLSAIALSRAGAAAVAVLGTSIDPTQAAEIAQGRDRVLGWFDGDPAGDKAYVRLRKRMALYGVQVHRIRTAEDPKALHREQLRQILNDNKGVQYGPQ